MKNDWKRDHTIEELERSVHKYMNISKFWFEEVGPPSSGLSISGIYVIEIEIKNEDKERHFLYVGQGGNVYKRLQNHFDGTGKQHIDNIIQQILKESGEGRYKYYLTVGVVYCDYEDLNFLERYYQRVWEQYYHWSEQTNRIDCGRALKKKQTIPLKKFIPKVDEKIYNQTVNDFYVWEEDVEAGIADYAHLIDRL